MVDSKIKEGDEVAWNWGSGAPGGTAAKVKENEPVTMETKRGNQVKKKGEPGNPAVYVKRSGHDVVKKASELKVQSKASNSGASKKSNGTKDEGEGQEEQASGQKRKQPADSKENQKEQTNGQSNKKQKSSGEGGAATTSKKQTKKREPKRATTENGQPRRSGRLAAASK